MEIHSATFVKSSAEYKQCPAASYPEYAFAGRSNVGKSSLLNMLMNVKNLAKTSSTPGKTRLINHFLVNEAWYLVDLPGYGYAKTGKKTRDAFLPLIGEYLLQRETLACLFILIDSRHEPLQNDLDFIAWAGEKQLPLALVFTKTDKLSTDQLNRQVTMYKKTLLIHWEELPAFFTSSAQDHAGDKDILNFIGKTNKNFYNAQSQI